MDSKIFWSGYHYPAQFLRQFKRIANSKGWSNSTIADILTASLEDEAVDTIHTSRS